MREGSEGGQNGPDQRPDAEILDFASFKKSREKREIIKGAEFTIPDLGAAPNFGYETELPWVTIVRGETGHGPKDKGVIKTGNTVTVMGTSNEFGVLCRYNTPTGGAGTELVDGSFFFIAPDELLFWPKLVELQEKKQKRMKEEVTRILDQE